jgi:hypothetical protein
VTWQTEPDKKMSWLTWLEHRLLHVNAAFELRTDYERELEIENDAQRQYIDQLEWKLRFVTGRSNTTSEYRPPATMKMNGGRRDTISAAGGSSMRMKAGRRDTIVPDDGAVEQYRPPAPLKMQAGRRDTMSAAGTLMPPPRPEEKPLNHESAEEMQAHQSGAMRMKPGVHNEV